MTPATRDEEVPGVWLTEEDFQSLHNKANRRQLTWPECVFGIFFMFFVLILVGIIVHN